MERRCVCRGPRQRSPPRAANAREWTNGCGYSHFRALGRGGRCGRGRGRTGREAGNRPSPRTHALHARPRRAPRVRGHRCPALPRRPELDPGRVHGGRRLLRDQRLPHHVAAARGAQEPQPRRPRPVLPAPGPPPAPRAVPRARGHVALRRRVPPRRGHEAARRCRRRARVRHELVADLPQHLVLRGVRPAADAPAPVVARGRGAVLPDLAAAARRACSSSGTGAAGRCSSPRSR